MAAERPWVSDPDHETLIDRAMRADGYERVMESCEAPLGSAGDGWQKLVGWCKKGTYVPWPVPLASNFFTTNTWLNADG
jgi:hypothetical protein